MAACCGFASTVFGSPASTTAPSASTTTRVANSRRTRRRATSSRACGPRRRVGAASSPSSLRRAGIERRGRLVEQQQRRIDGQRARDRDALRFAARQLARQRRGAMADAELLEQRSRARLGLRPRPRAARGPARGRRCRAPTDARRGSGTGTPCRLSGAARAASAADRLALERDRVDADLAAVEALEPGDRAQDRRLARSREPHQRDDFAARRTPRSTPRRISRVPRASCRPRTSSMTSDARAHTRSARLPPLFEPPRQVRQRQRHREIQRRAQQRRESPSCRCWWRRSASAWSARRR